MSIDALYKKVHHGALRDDHMIAVIAKVGVLFFDFVRAHAVITKFVAIVL